MAIARTAMFDFPDIWLHAEESVVKGHGRYAAAKGGDIVAAGELIAELVDSHVLNDIQTQVGGSVQLVAIHALESTGVNEIPAALARVLRLRFGWTLNSSIVQTNSVGHTGASGFHRLANQAEFAGNVSAGQRYFLVDDFVGQGGTLANLIGFIASNGGEPVGATVLTGRSYSAKLAPKPEEIELLRQKHGPGLEEWWKERFGFDFDCLTRSEARYLERSASADVIRDRIVKEGPEVST